MTRSSRSSGLLMTGAVLSVMSLVAACGGEQEAAAPAPDDSGSEAGGAAGEEQAASCYEGETATFVVSFSPGGGYDIIARAAAPVLEEILGATVVVENIEGAGGLTAATGIFTGPTDGLTFGIFAGQGLVGSTLGEAPGVTFDPQEFSYVGRLAQDSRVMVTGAASEYETVEALQAASGVQFATSGVGAADHIDANVLINVLDLDGEVITGFQGSAETELAVTAGDVDAGSGTLGQRLGSIDNGDQRPLLAIGDERLEDLPDTPAMLELELADDKRALAEAHTALQQVGRIVIAAPDTEPACLAELQGAFEEVLSDEGFLTAVEGEQVPFEYLSGDETLAIVETVLGAPEEYREVLRGAYGSQ